MCSSDLFPSHDMFSAYNIPPLAEANLPTVAATLSAAPVVLAFDKKTTAEPCKQFHTVGNVAAQDAVNDLRHSLTVAACDAMSRSTSLCTKTLLPLLVLCIIQPAQALCTEIPEVILASRLLNLLYYAAVSYFVIRRGFVGRQFATIMFLICSGIYVMAQEEVHVEAPLDEVWVESLSELFWTYVNIILAIIRLHARLIFVFIDIIAPIAVTMWYMNKTADPIRYPNGAPVREAKYVAMTYLLWPGLIFVSTYTWFFVHQVVIFILLPVYITFLAIISWFNWWTSSDVKYFEIMLGHGILRKQLTHEELHAHEVEEEDESEDDAQGNGNQNAQANNGQAVPPPPPAVLPLRNYPDMRSQVRSLRKLTTTTLDLYLINVANLQIYLCTELLQSAVLHFMRSNPSKETIHNSIMQQTQFNLTDEEWIRHQQYLPSMVQYEVRQKKNDIVGVETIAEQLTNYDELSNRDKTQKSTTRPRERPRQSTLAAAR